MTPAPMVRLRPLDLSDADQLFEAARESVAEIHPWMEWCHPAYKREESVGWLEFQVGAREKEAEFTYAIVDANHRFLGSCSLNQFNRMHNFANLGYWVRTSATGRGVAREAVRQLRDVAFREKGFTRVEIVCAVGNVRSQRVAESVGALREGILRNRLTLHGKAVDAVMFGLTPVR
jgi:ribosomal-protein-serine acetyltransferase